MAVGEILKTYLTLLFIMNPFGALPVYLDIAERLHPWERRKLANTVTAVVAGILAVTALTGDAILRLYGISLSGFQFAGGVILLSIGVARLSGHPVTQTPDPRDAALVPLATPLLVGPAAMTYVIAAAHTSEAVTLAAVAAATATLWVLLELSELILRLLGRSIMRLLTRITSLFVAGIGAELLHAALHSWGIAPR